MPALLADKDFGFICVEGKVPCQKIYEDELSLAILDINPFSKGHCLVIPKRHVPWWHELSDEENASLFKVAKVVSEKIMKAKGDILDRFFNALELVQESPVELAALHKPASMEEIADLLREA